MCVMLLDNVIFQRAMALLYSMLLAFHLSIQ